MTETIFGIQKELLGMIIFVAVIAAIGGESDGNDTEMVNV